MEAEKINGTLVPESIHFGEPGIDYPPYFSSRFFEKITPKVNLENKLKGTVILFGTAGEVDNNNFEKLWGNLK